MAARNLESLFIFFVVLFFLIIVIACCSTIKPSDSTNRHSIVNMVKRRRGRRGRGRNREAFRDQSDGLNAEEIPTASPMVVPPYPVEPLHPTPQTVPPGPGFATANPPYPTINPHPIGGAAPYIPAVAPYPPASTPYPPSLAPIQNSTPYTDYAGQPPSYSEAVAQPPIQPPLPAKEGYSKQSPYNPNY